MIKQPTENQASDCPLNRGNSTGDVMWRVCHVTGGEDIRVEEWFCMDPRRWLTSQPLAWLRPLVGIDGKDAAP